MRPMRTLLAVGIATLAFPAASSAQTSQQQNVNGVVGSELSITDPSDLSIPSMTHAGPNADSDTLTLTTTNATGATITATDSRSDALPADGYLASASPLSQPLSFTFANAVSGPLNDAGVSYDVSAPGVTGVSVAVSQSITASDAIVEGDSYSMTISYAAVENAPEV